MKRVLIFLINLYRNGISRYTKPHCRFVPTCSEYAIEAIERFGPIKGVGLTIIRLLKCQPFHPGGYDPVPEKRTKTK